jgi:hypothetical protein
MNNPGQFSRRAYGAQFGVGEPNVKEVFDRHDILYDVQSHWFSGPQVARRDLRSKRIEYRFSTPQFFTGFRMPRIPTCSIRPNALQDWELVVIVVPPGMA